MLGSPASAHVYEAPTELNGSDTRTRLFLAGGITDCPDWQSEMVTLLWDLPLALMNPRRAVWPSYTPEASREQIEWESRHLHKANAVLFWFCAATICPIVLYELGVWSSHRGLRGHKPIFVGIEPGYSRTLDVEIQTGLIRPDVTIVSSLEDLAKQVREFME